MSSNELSADEVLLAPVAVPVDAVQRLERGRVTLVGRMRNASNGTFLVRVDDPDLEVAPRGEADPCDRAFVSNAEPAEHSKRERNASSGRTYPLRPMDGEAPPWGLAIYKPRRGERPLWDFEPGLYRREVAAYVLSETTGLGVVPPTVVRDDAPLGVGSLQWFVNADFSHHYFSIYEEHPEVHDQLRAIAAFDVMANNTDRKGGHCLLEPAAAGSDASPHVWAIDNGLCFAESFKLRTVIWEYAGEPLPATLLSAAQHVANDAPAALHGLLTEAEVGAIERRAAQLVDIGVFPFDQSSHGYPWPLV